MIVICVSLHTKEQIKIRPQDGSNRTERNCQSSDVALGTRIYSKVSRVSDDSYSLQGDACAHNVENYLQFSLSFFVIFGAQFVDRHAL